MEESITTPCGIHGTFTLEKMHTKSLFMNLLTSSIQCGEPLSVATKGKKSNFTQVVVALAHEVRTPLLNINLSLELLQSAPDIEEQKMYMEIISRNSRRISCLIDELLQYQPLNEEPADGGYSARQLLDEVLEMAGDRILLRGIQVQKEYAKADCILQVHAGKMRIALNNIVINAIEAMTMERKSLTLATRFVDDGYMIRIEDTGTGISKENLPYIFTPYVTGRAGGLGLGLSTAYSILMSSRVHISVESEEGRGTQFILVFRQPS